MKSATGLLVTLLGFGFAAAACSSNDSSAKKTITRTQNAPSVFTPTALEATVNNMVAAINQANPDRVQLNVIFKEQSSYFTPMIVGANRAIGELGATGSATAPGTADIDAQTADEIQMINDDMGQGSKGIGIAPMGEPVVPAINAAVAAGLPVVTIDSDQADSNRDLYIGTINAPAGTTAGNTLLKYLTTGSGTVIVLGQTTTDWPDGYNRTMSAVNVLQTAGYTPSVLKAKWDDNGATDLASMANIFATAAPPVVGLMGMFSDAYECAQAAEAAGKTGNDVAIVAFDFDARTVSYMKSGLIKATHAQRQYYMGYLTPYVLYGMRLLGKDKTKAILAPQMVDQYSFDTGLDIVDASQLDQYSQFLDSLGVGSNN
jgi:ribose transport system substrate-binding protein